METRGRRSRASSVPARRLSVANALDKGTSAPARQRGEKQRQKGGSRSRAWGAEPKHALDLHWGKEPKLLICHIRDVAGLQERNARKHQALSCRDQTCRPCFRLGGSSRGRKRADRKISQGKTRPIGEKEISSPVGERWQRPRLLLGVGPRARTSVQLPGWTIRRLR